MRKKIISFCLVTAVAATLCACTANGGNTIIEDLETTVEETTASATETVTEEKTEESTEEVTTEQEVSTELEPTIRALFDENFYVITQVYYLGCLPIKGEYVDGTDVYEVDCDKFPTYQAFEDYIKSVYAEPTAIMLLNDYPFEGQQMYLDVDGKLYIDMTKIGGKGYYVDWSNYTVEIKDVTDSTCNFVLHASVEYPAEEPTPEPYDVEGSMTLQNGSWVLDTVLY